jgi:hypothetical protein
VREKISASPHNPKIVQIVEVQRKPADHRDYTDFQPKEGLNQAGAHGSLEAQSGSAPKR